MERTVPHWRRWIIAAFLVLGAAGWAIRLSTVKIGYKDDPSTGLVWRTEPSCERKIRATGTDVHRTYVIQEDDNTFAGEWFYDWLVDWATLLGPAGALVAALYDRRARRAGLRRGSRGN
jgi:hypothetical protein